MPSKGRRRRKTQAAPKIPAVVRAYERALRKAAKLGRRGDWLGAAAAAARALALRPDDAPARRLLASIEREVQTAHPRLAARIAQTLALPVARTADIRALAPAAPVPAGHGARAITPPVAARAASDAGAPGPTDGNTAPAGWLARLGVDGYVGAHLYLPASLLLTVVLLAGAGPINGTWAYFTNRQVVTGSYFYAYYLQAVSSVTATPDGNGNLVITWNAVEGFAHYEVHMANAPDGPYTLIGTTAAGVTTFTWTPPSDGLYYFQVLARAGSNWVGPSMGAGQYGYTAYGY